MNKAYLINSADRTVTEVEIDNWQEISPMLDASMFSVVGMGSDDLYVDDEGLLGRPESFFYVRGHQDPIAGKGLVMGHDDMGESTDPTLTLEGVKEMVLFPSDADNALIASNVEFMFG
jgi:hypothetical protein